jgi:hypothetical protein
MDGMILLLVFTLDEVLTWRFWGFNLRACLWQHPFSAVLVELDSTQKTSAGFAFLSGVYTPDWLIRQDKRSRKGR